MGVRAVTTTYDWWGGIYAFILANLAPQMPDSDFKVVVQAVRRARRGIPRQPHSRSACNIEALFTFPGDAARGRHRDAPLTVIVLMPWFACWSVWFRLTPTNVGASVAMVAA